MRWIDRFFGGGGLLPANYTYYIHTHAGGCPPDWLLFQSIATTTVSHEGQEVRDTYLSTYPVLMMLGLLCLSVRPIDRPTDRPIKMPMTREIDPFFFPHTRQTRSHGRPSMWT